MQKLIACSLLLVLAASACTTRSGPITEAQAQAAFLAGQQAAMARMQSQGLTVQVVGQVINPFIPWTEDLTLAKAIVAADYHGADPREILIHRDGETIRVIPQALLRGKDPPLQPHDVVEIRP